MIYIKKNDFDIVILIFTLTGLKQLRFSWLSRHISLEKPWASNMIVRLLRKVYLFISQSSLYCVALCVLKLWALTKLLNTKTLEWLHLIFMSEVCYKELIDLHYNHNFYNYIITFVCINISICTKLHVFSVWASEKKISCFFLHILTISDSISYKQLFTR